MLGLHGMLKVFFTAAEGGRIWYGSSFMWKAVEQAVLSTVCI